MTTQDRGCYYRLQEANNDIRLLHRQLHFYINQRDKLDKCIFENNLLSKSILEINQGREKCMERERDLLQQQASLQEPTMSPHGMPRETMIHGDDSKTPKTISLRGGAKREKNIIENLHARIFVIEKCKRVSVKPENIRNV